MIVKLFRPLIFKAIKYLPHNNYGDRIFGLIRFVMIHNRLPNQNKFTDRLYNIKTTDEVHNPLRVFVTDKEYVKLYIKAQVGDKYNIPTLAVLRSEADIDDFAPMQDCVIKAAHSSGKRLIHEAGGPIDKKMMKSWLAHNYYTRIREANYKYIKPKIIVEPLLFKLDMAVDYKVFCVHGVPKMIKVVFDRHAQKIRKFYDLNWQPLPFTWDVPPSEKGIQKPKKLNELLYLAGKLSEHFDFIRIDFYIVNDDILVGEITNCDGGGEHVFCPKEGEEIATKLCFNS